MTTTLNSELLLHPRTASGIEAFLSQPTHALLVVGPQGSGKLYLARQVAARLLGLDVSKLDNYPYFIHLARAAGRQDISIDEIRRVISGAKLKIPASRPVNKVVLIEDAQLMSLPAQNAFLKTLEEPNAGTVFILTADSVHSILPTIASRTRKLVVSPLPLADVLEFFSRSHDKAEIEAAWHLSGGLIGTIQSYLAGGEEDHLRQAIDDAKRLITLDRLNLLAELEELASRDQLDITLQALDKIYAALHRAAVKNQSSNMASLLRNRKLVAQSHADLEANANQRLVILNLALNLKI